jgi:hypothetical protein
VAYFTLVSKHLSVGTEGYHGRCHYNLKTEILKLDLQNTKQEFCSLESDIPSFIFTSVKSTSVKKSNFM